MSLSLRNLLFLIVATCWCALPRAWAGVSFQPVSPDELKMTSEPLAPGAPAIILYRQVDRDDNGRTSHEDNYLRIKILTEEGRKYANIEIPFYKRSGDIVNIHARTIQPNGAIVNFDGKVFEKSVVKARGVQYLVKTFTLPDVQVGGIIEYFFTIDLAEHFIYDSHWILSNELFTKRAQFSLKPYRTTNVAINLRWTGQNFPSGQVLPKEGPDGIVRLEATNIAAFQTEDYMPPPNELKQRVDFIYEEGILEKDPAQYWKRVGKNRNDVLESFIDKRKAMEQAVAQIISPNDAPEAKLRKIYDRVQQIRNTTYEPRKTEEEEKRAKEKPPENVEDLWKRGYGNGQQLTWLYLALVRAAGFEAYGCWVSDRREYFFNPQLEQSSKLNANVVLVKLNGKDLYLDPGSAFTPFGLLGWDETATRGLRLDKDGGTWIETTLPQASESQLLRSAKLTLSDTGDLEGKLTVTYTGLPGMYHRRYLRNADDVERKKYLEDRMKQQIPGTAQVELTNKPDWSNSEKPLVAEFDLKVTGWASNAGKRTLLPLGLFSGGQKRTFEHADRVHPIYVEYPYEDLDDITIQLPAGWKVESLPRPQEQDGHVVVYDIKAESSNGVLHLTRKFHLDFLLLDPKYYSALRNFFQVVRAGDEDQVVLQPASATASN